MNLSVLVNSTLLISQTKKDPLKTVTITSNCAVAQHCKDVKATHLTYKENVVVTLDDGTTINTDQLATSFDHTKTSSKSLKKIICTGSVVVKKEQETVTSDNAELDPATKKCFLRGSVVLTRTPEATSSKKSFPTVTRSEYAEIDLQTGVVSILGTLDQPVTTIISLS